MTTSTERSQQPTSDTLEIAVCAAVAAFPPLTGDQRERIAHLLRSCVEADEPQPGTRSVNPALPPAGSGIAGEQEPGSDLEFGGQVVASARDSDCSTRDVSLRAAQLLGRDGDEGWVVVAPVARPDPVDGDAHLEKPNDPLLGLDVSGLPGLGRTGPGERVQRRVGRLGRA